MGRGRIIAAALMLVFVSAGCWGQPGAGAGNTFSNDVESTLTVDNVAALDEVWSGRGGVSAVMNGRVVGAYWTGTGVDVVAHNVSSGAEVWSRTLSPPGAVSGYPTHQPVVTGGDVWAGYQVRTAAGTCAFGLARLDLASGNVLGTDTTNAPTELVPFGDQVGLVTQTYMPSNLDDTCWPSGSATQQVADGGTGTTEWSAGWYASEELTVVGDRLFATLGSQLRSYPSAGCGAPTCAPTWTTQPAGAGALYDLAGSASGPLVATAPGPQPVQLSLHAIDPATGASLGSTPLSFNASSSAVANGTVYVAGDTTLAAYDVASCAAGSCTKQWSATLGGTATWANGLAVAGGVVYVGRTDGVVEAYAAAGCGAATCASVTSVAIDDTVMQLAVSQGRLFVGSIDTVTAFAPTA
jgi:PQQ-like domain